MSQTPAEHSPAVASFVGDWSGQIITTAIHAGHDLREEVAEAMILDETVRLREEDPHTDRIGAHLPARVIAHRSRFEVDLNRVREEAVYREPDDCWGLEVWRETPLDDDIAQRSLEVYDSFYAELAERLDEVSARGPFVVYDVHSYNHRRDGELAEPADPEHNPEVNVGTGSMDRERWGQVVDTFITALGGSWPAPRESGPRMDVRENVKFVGRGLAQWVHERYPDTGIVLALEFKKTFMDEWSGEVDETKLAEVSAALADTYEPVLHALRDLSGKTFYP
ncbi:N-formylglutamate amidohydrolase [Marihabitans asiaticum]|uniref:N-formylglutamate amidohydrolase n=1 Tax=Marihabitans asiaticum TaxID=415218 RepID=A0A560WHB6_9MICO|nr:N-formylglutamate amidohydrolase [Marihabitans asiaticum]TWD16875.1 N-formylglutamate amidohydrolase [Marihabitans asiaticum]